MQEFDESLLKEIEAESYNLNERDSSDGNELSLSSEAMDIEDINSMDYSKLPNELWLKIFSFFSLKELARVRTVSREFLSFTTDPQLLSSLPKQFDYSKIDSKNKLLADKEDSFREMAISAKGGMIATINKENDKIFLFDAKDLALMGSIPKRTSHDYCSLAFTKDDKYLVMSSSEIEVWDIQENQLKSSFPILRDHGGRISSFNLLSGNHFVVSYIYYENDYDDYAVKNCLEIYNIETQKLVTSFNINAKALYSFISTSPDETLLVCANRDGIDLYDIKSQNLIKNMKINFIPYRCSKDGIHEQQAEEKIRAEMTNDNKFIVCNALGRDSSGIQVQKWNIESETYTSITLKSHYSSGNQRGLIFSISKNGKYLAAAAPYLRCIKIYNIQTFQVIKKHIMDDNAFITHLYFSSDDGKIIINNLKSIEVISFPTKNLENNIDPIEMAVSKNFV